MIDSVHIPALLVDLGYQASTSQARKSIDAGAVLIDGVVVVDYDWSPDQVYGHTLRVGRNREIQL